MTDAEIIKALENVAEWFTEHGRNTNTAVIGISRQAIDLINRQKAEIERLTAEQEEYPFKCKVGNNSEIHSKSIQDYDKLIADISAEAIKEFAERLKGELTEILMWYEVGNFEYPAYDPNKTHNVINNLVKEMVGDDNDG